MGRNGGSNPRLIITDCYGFHSATRTAFRKKLEVEIILLLVASFLKTHVSITFHDFKLTVEEYELLIARAINLVRQTVSYCLLVIGRAFIQQGVRRNQIQISVSMVETVKENPADVHNGCVL